MNSSPDTREVLCCPTALLPLGLSLGALLVVLLHIAFFGPASAPDEGAAAHVWQILMVAQIPALALFMSRWFRIARRPAFRAPSRCMGWRSPCPSPPPLWPRFTFSISEFAGRS